VTLGAGESAGARSSAASNAPIRTPKTPKVEQASKAVLRCQQLSKRFGGVIAVQRLDMEVEAGQILAVIGPNGLVRRGVRERP
jgi:ATPase subunit of ABC transporter with duplicated ATPase domains